MRRYLVLSCLTVLSLSASAFAQGIHEPFKPPVTAAKIRTAIDDAVYSPPQPPGGRRPSLDSGDGGYTALATLTLLAAGADPAADDQLKKTLDWLGQAQAEQHLHPRRAGQRLGIRPPQGHVDNRLTALLKDDYDWLMAAKGDKTGWRYQMESTDWDNSCTQYGVLGVWAATRAGIDPGDKFWQKLSQHFRDCQNADGGWGYTTGSGSTPNMATAGWRACSSSSTCTTARASTAARTRARSPMETRRP